MLRLCLLLPILLPHGLQTANVDVQDIAQPNTSSRDDHNVASLKTNYIEKRVCSIINNVLVHTLAMTVLSCEN